MSIAMNSLGINSILVFPRATIHLSSEDDTVSEQLKPAKHNSITSNCFLKSKCIIHMYLRSYQYILQRYIIVSTFHQLNRKIRFYLEQR